MKQSLIYVLAFLLVAISLQVSYLFDFPSHIHAWAQSDRYALALGFMDNGFDLFHPQTYTLNHQFPGEFRIPSNNSITPVDLPLSEYLVGLVMQVIQVKSIVVFKLYTLLYSLVGFVFLFRLCGLFTTNRLVQLTVVLFALSSPVLVYYQAGTLPTVVSLANACIGLYYYLRFRLGEQDPPRMKHFYLGILFLGLASLARLPFAIFLLSALCMEGYASLQTKKFDWKRYLPFALGIGLIGLQLAYNARLGRQYGSMFLNHIMPAESMDEVREIFRWVSDNRTFEYFSPWHYALFLAALVLIVLRRKDRSPAQRLLGLFLLISFGGCMAYSVLMLRQFLFHDYYVLDTFFIPLVLLLLYGLSRLKPLPMPRSRLLWIVPLVFISGAGTWAMQVQKERRQNLNDVAYTCILDYKHAKSLLDSMAVPADAKLLILDAPTPNLPFIFTERKGYVVMDKAHDKLLQAIGWNYDYAVSQNRHVMELLEKCPEIANHLKVIARNEGVTLWKPDPSLLIKSENGS